jgi:hypothetical protein
MIVVDVRVASDGHVAQMMYIKISIVGARHDAEISFDACNKGQRVGLWLSQLTYLSQISLAEPPLRLHPQRLLTSQPALLLSEAKTFLMYTYIEMGHRLLCDPPSRVTYSTVPDSQAQQCDIVPGLLEHPTVI